MGMIQDLGIRMYLDATKDKHNGFDFTDFERMVAVRASINSISKSFAVSRPTIYSWISLLNNMKEQTEKDSK